MKLCVIRPFDKYSTGHRISDEAEAAQILGSHPQFVVRVSEDSEEQAELPEPPATSPTAAIEAVRRKKAKAIQTADNSGDNITD